MPTECRTNPTIKNPAVLQKNQTKADIIILHKGQ